MNKWLIECITVYFNIHVKQFINKEEKREINDYWFWWLYFIVNFKEYNLVRIGLIVNQYSS